VHNNIQPMQAVLKCACQFILRFHLWVLFSLSLVFSYFMQVLCSLTSLCSVFLYLNGFSCLLVK